MAPRESAGSSGGRRYTWVRWRRKVVPGWPLLVCLAVMAGTALGVLILQPFTPSVVAKGKVQVCVGSLKSTCKGSHPAVGLVVEFRSASFPGRVYRTATQTDGTFSITIPAGKYLVIYSGCQKYISGTNSIQELRTGWYDSRWVDSAGNCDSGGIAL